MAEYRNREGLLLLLNDALTFTTEPPEVKSFQDLPTTYLNQLFKEELERDNIVGEIAVNRLVAVVGKAATELDSMGTVHATKFFTDFAETGAKSDLYPGLNLLAELTTNLLQIQNSNSPGWDFFVTTMHVQRNYRSLGFPVHQAEEAGYGPYAYFNIHEHSLKNQLDRVQLPEDGVITNDWFLLFRGAPKLILNALSCGPLVSPDSDGVLDVIPANWFGTIEAYLNMGRQLPTTAKELVDWSRRK